HDLVAVDHLAGGVDGQTPVRVAVVRQAQVGAVRAHRGADVVEVGGTAVVVDVVAVGAGVDLDHRGAGLAVGTRGRRAGGAVGAVDDDDEPVQPARRGIEQVPDIAVQGVLLRGPRDTADRRAGRSGDGTV